MKTSKICYILLILFFTSPSWGQTALLKNGGFEEGGVPGWQAFEAGFDADRRVFRTGEQSIRCDITRPERVRGAFVRLSLDQKQPAPIFITGWSRADAVSGVSDNDYAIYADLEYSDGTFLYGQTAPFSTGTHDWERRQLLLQPTKPIKSLSLYALFRHHVGTAWFDDFYVRELKGDVLFDSQLLTFPRRNRPNAPPAGMVEGKDGLKLGWNADGSLTQLSLAGNILGSLVGGFFVRDVGAEGGILPLAGSIKVRPAGKGVDVQGAFGDSGLVLNARLQPEGDSIGVDAQVLDTTKRDRAVTLYLALPLNATGWDWGQDIRTAEKIQADREYSHQVGVRLGATGSLSLYPFAVISNGRQGLGIANQMDWPSVYRLFYSGNQRQMVIAWDFALTSKSATWPPNRARGRCTLFALTKTLAEYGFRGGLQRFYQLNADAYVRRAKHEGIWMPFHDPAKVEHPEDFGIAYHEGDNSIKTDDSADILSFRYTEPSSYWLPMPPEMPRTYENALSLIQKNAQSTNVEERNWARAVLNSGTQDSKGRFNLEFQNQPWTNGAVFLLNPNPELPNTEEQPTKASLAYNFLMANKFYGKANAPGNSGLDGEYLDSLESWAETADYRPSHLLTCPYPLTFDRETRQPVVPQFFATYTFARFLRDDLRNRKKLLMANTTPVRFSVFAPLFDVMGIEVNWLWGDGSWHPDSDATFNLRRAMSGKKPYLLLMNTQFEKFTPEYVERYFQACLFYGVYPSMFSADAATNTYWDNPKWYNRDRALFKKYIPLIKKASAAGWEPITHAKTDNPLVGVERFGNRYLTLRNLSNQKQETTLRVDFDALKLPLKTPLPKDFLRVVSYSITLKAEETLLLTLGE
jgi:hypothetical protein